MSDSVPQKQPRIYKVLLMTLPVGVVVGTIIFMFMYFYNERRDEREHAVIASHGLRVSDLEDMVGKFTNRIGSRDIETEAGRAGIRSAASMIEGRLGPQNVGFPVSKSEGLAAHGLLWKSLSVEIRGENNPDEIVFAAVSFSGKGEVADANCTSTMVMLASAMARDKPARTLRFVFLPMDQSPREQNQWLLERCLGAGERCVGIIGLKTMQGIPETGAGDWSVITPTEADQAWWAHISSGGAAVAGGTPSVWATHSVFSPDTWVDKKAERLERTLDVAREIRAWVLKASE